MKNPMRFLVLGLATAVGAACCGCSLHGGPGVGAAAPPTRGTDADGVAFQLSDYRGKAVMLEFWGDW
ncbi:MAG TPA: hypothetical protein VMS17_17510 [Gemmataceae bacterium]|nr:hypothetical protein [Gemmataceae bacterium]